ncbi:MAG: DNA polymerase III subunit gamma/tau [Patescibacteria group bacterium]
MAKTLYRIYRPISFAEIINQKHVVTTLMNELANDRVAHAYLFTGPRGIGKTTTARIFAKAVNCDNRNKNGEPCDQCERCQELNQGNNLDLIEIDAASHTQVDNVRENIIPNAQTAPTHSRYKVFIIDEVHMLSVSAFNALLKIIEEPPATVIFILATTEVHRVPLTIISRCQRFDFHQLAVADLIKRLEYILIKEDVSVEPSVLRTIAIRAGGSARDAESLLGQVLSLGEKNITADMASVVIPQSETGSFVTLLQSLTDRSVTSALEEINRLVDEGVSITRFVNEWLEFLRQIILAKLGALKWEDLPLADDQAVENVKKLTQQLKVKQLIQVVEIFQKHQRNLSISPLPQFPVEMAFIELIGSDDNSEATPPANNTKARKTSPAKDIPRENIKPAEEPKETSEPIASVNIKSGVGVTKEEVQKLWPELIKQISKANHSLGMIIKGGQVVEISDGNQIIIGFKFKLHAERVNSSSRREKLIQGLAKLLGKAVSVKAIVVPGKKADTDNISQPTVKEEADLSSLVAQTFGKGAQ